MPASELNITKWIEKAQEDELACRILLKSKDAPQGHICFWSQQVAEKYLKALLIFHKKSFPKVHDLKHIATLIEPFVTNIFDLEDDLTILNKFYPTTRYPADIPEGFSRQDAQEAFDAALRVKEFVLRAITSRKEK